MDGMPRSRGAGDASAQYLIYLDYARKERDKAQRSLDKAKYNAMRVCRKLSGHMRKFCEAYYAQCLPFDIAQTLSGVQRSRCYDYINAVKRQAAEIGPNRT